MTRHSPPLRPRLLAALLLGAVAGWDDPAYAQADEQHQIAPPARSEAVARAEQLAAEALEAYRLGDARTAIDLYLKAYALAPSADILFNVARVHDLALNDRRSAIEFYRRSAAQPDATPERVRTAHRRLSELQQLERQALELEREEAQEQAQAARAVRPSTTRTGAAEADGARDAGTSGFRTAAWGLGLAGIAGLGVGTGFGLLALGRANRAHDDCDGNLCRSQAGADAAREATVSGNVATAGFVAGGVLLAAAGWLLLLDDEPSEAERAQVARLHWNATVSNAQVSLQLGGQW